jgi:hypothetical protein
MGNPECAGAILAELEQLRADVTASAARMAAAFDKINGRMDALDEILVQLAREANAGISFLARLHPGRP